MDSVNLHECVKQEICFRILQGNFELSVAKPCISQSHFSVLACGVCSTVAREIVHKSRHTTDKKFFSVARYTA